jgi:hypothetical protein
MDARRPIRRLQIHAAHACNLTCDGCSHFSNYGHAGIVTPEDARAQLAPWSRRLRVTGRFAILGGEPTLNPRLTEFVAVVLELFPDAPLEVATNGFFLDRHPDLPGVLKGRGQIVLGKHGDDDAYLARYTAATAVAARWKADGLIVKEHDPTGAGRWTSRYRGYGPTMAPFDDGDARASWRACEARTCTQVHAGGLWKCNHLAYLPMQAERFPQIVPRFARALAYKPLEPTATDAELDAFLSCREEDACSGCPAKPRPFVHGSALVPARTLLRKAQNAA